MFVGVSDRELDVDNRQQRKDECLNTADNQAHEPHRHGEEERKRRQCQEGSQHLVVADHVPHQTK